MIVRPFNCHPFAYFATLTSAKQAAGLGKIIAKVAPMLTILGPLARLKRLPHTFRLGITDIPVPVSGRAEMLHVGRKPLSDASLRSHVAA
jgi:hypothetical protein